ncbi:uncharacterized protein [Paramormyrops kingsleyae]|uniref:uncharacterized protein isoform X2 n=1 Tax=Paramormyrops kingsleyae TaxID=1676925 RepID=UPI003B971066
MRIMVSLEPYSEIISDMLRRHATHADISQHLQNIGVGRGCSVMSIRRFCDAQNLKRGVSDAQLEIDVSTAITEGLRNFNPVPYHAAYMGHKVHLDQNEKLAMFGVTHVIAVDGYSSKVVAYATMPVKNNLTIYEEVYRSAVVNYGLWDQVRVDHGKEFYLSLFIQEILAPYRHNQDKPSYCQTTSTKNHKVERLWPEINSRVNYPLKEALIHLTDQELLDMDCNISRYCVSNLTGQLCKIGIKRVVEAWNEHRIPGKGIPNQLAGGGCPKKVSEVLLPHASEAANLYNEELRSTLTTDSSFGTDPFTYEEQKATVERVFTETYPDIAELLNSTVNKNHSPFKDAVLYLINLTKRHMQ